MGDGMTVGFANGVAVGPGVGVGVGPAGTGVGLRRAAVGVGVNGGVSSEHWAMTRSAPSKSKTMDARQATTEWNGDLGDPVENISIQDNDRPRGVDIFMEFMNFTSCNPQPNLAIHRCKAWLPN